MTSPSSAARPRVLIVDDTAVKRVRLRRVLEPLDCELVEAPDGETALRLLTEQEFALALLDIKLPGIDGYELADWIRRDGRNRKLPILFVTATALDAENRFRGYESGAVDYLTEPVDAYILRSKVRVFVELWQAREELRQLMEEHSRLAAAAQREALHDGLTGLPNRRQFMEWLRHAVARSQRQKARFALMYVDLDEFKPVNDAHGHQAGDELLRLLAARMKHALRAEDLIARVGGDEFIALLEAPIDETMAQHVAERFALALGEPVRLELSDRDEVPTVRVGISYGIALFPDDASDADALIRAADSAMYACKQEHKRARRESGSASPD